MKYIVPGRKRLPYGMMNFADIRLDNYYYVDKTGLIKTLLQGEMDQVTLITRPRRFGKTMAMNTMCRLRRQVIMATTKKC